jgi:hypothetical protein
MTHDANAMKCVVMVKGVRHLAVNPLPDETDGVSVYIPCLRQKWGNTRFWASKVEEVPADTRCCWRCEKTVALKKPSAGAVATRLRNVGHEIRALHD